MMFRGNSACDVAAAGPVPQQALCTTSRSANGDQLHHSRVAVFFWNELLKSLFLREYLRDFLFL